MGIKSDFRVAFNVDDNFREAINDTLEASKNNMQHYMELATSEAEYSMEVDLLQTDFNNLEKCVGLYDFNDMFDIMWNKVVSLFSEEEVSTLIKAQPLQVKLGAMSGSLFEEEFFIYFKEISESVSPTKEELH